MPEAPDFPLEERPRLRAVEVFPAEDRGRRLVVLRDPSDAELPPMALANGAIPVLRLIDGQRTLSAIHARLALGGASPSLEDLRGFLHRLDEAGYLEGPRARYRAAQRRAAFAARPERPAVHAGGAYPSDPGSLWRTICEGFLHPDGPGRMPAPANLATAPPRAIVAPHVDLHRGAPTYAWAYRALAEARPAGLYVVLGTCHTPVEGGFAATRKPYATPFGPVAADTAFLDRLGRLWGRDLARGEFSHASEHSIEFQAVYLRAFERAGAGGGPSQAAMVPILCDSLHSLAPGGRPPRDVALVADFVDALCQAIAEDGREVTLIAAADLAHVGPRFGDPWRVDAARGQQVERDDRETLALLAAGDAEGYYQHVLRDGDARRICGLTPLYLLAALLGPGADGELLRYTACVDPDGSSSVTFASMVFPAP